MAFAGMNYLAVIIAAIAAFLWGAVFYGVLGKPWMAAARIDPAGQKGKPMAPLLVNSIIWELVMAAVMAGVIGHFGASGLMDGAITGLMLWLGFLLPSMAINHRYEGFGWNLTLIDGAHWLGVAVIMGAVIGWSHG